MSLHDGRSYDEIDCDELIQRIEEVLDRDEDVEELDFNE